MKKRQGRLAYFRSALCLIPTHARLPCLAHAVHLRPEKVSMVCRRHSWPVPGCEAEQKIPDDQRAPTRALIVSVQTWIDLHEIKTRYLLAAAGEPRARKECFARQARCIRRAHARHVRASHGIGIEGDIDRAARFFEATQFMLKVIGQGVPDPVAPANDAAAPQDVLEVLTAHAMRLSAQTRVTMARQRPDGMFHGLAKRRAAMPETIDARANIQMSVHIQNGDRLCRLHIAQEVAEGRFMAAAQNHGNGTRL